MVNIDFSKMNNLVPTIVQDYQTKRILMLGFMNNDAYEKTRSTGYATFWSRSRNELWTKGDTSGNRLKVVHMHTDCDADAVLVEATLEGKACCHTGERSCFFNELL